MSEHAGNRWYKCDLHLHTTASRCYLDKEDTPRDWVNRAIEQGLSAVAVTDHNNYLGIGAIMEEGKANGLAVFPGTEITCDSTKIHILVIFDTDKREETVRDFLNRCDIDSEHAGDPDGTSMSVFEVCEIAKKRGALVIAAHIDEFNSISTMNPANLDRLFDGGYIDAVQVTNVPVWRQYEADKDEEAMNSFLAEKYGPDATPQEIDRWRKCYNRAKEAGLPMLAFSDNPRSESESRHGLWGIGSVYTWIQMDDVVNLESIRQSLVVPESRIRMIFDSVSEPRTEPDFWIRSLEIRKTGLNPYSPIHFDFNPQLNCIIGGKGSGKSAAIRVLSGIYQQFLSPMVARTYSSQNDFYRRFSDDNKGIFHEDSEIEMQLSWHGVYFRLLVTDINSLSDQKFIFLRIDPETGEESEADVSDLLSSPYFSAQVLTQREINEIAGTPGALLEFTDRSIPAMEILKARREYYLRELINISAAMHSTGRFLEHEGRVKAEQEWFGKLKDTDAFAGNTAEKADARQKILDDMSESRKSMEEMQEKRKVLLDKYEQCFKNIRTIRQKFLEEALAGDENYKLELVPSASRESFKNIIREVVSGDTVLPSLLSEDFKKLESALFSKDDGHKYRDLLTLARKGLEEGNLADQSAGSNDYFAYFAQFIRKMDAADFERLLLFRPEDEINMFYKPSEGKKYNPMMNASSGEKSAAILSFILANSTVPLIIDQPEDDMDNRVIYEEIVGKFKRAKQNRQIIIVSHNANLTLNTDPEMIISMDSHSKFVRIKMQGSADNDDIRREVCDVVEGTEKAFMQRARKYHLKQE